jgi:hypothetical protein
MADERHLGDPVLHCLLPIGLLGNPQHPISMRVFQAQNIVQQAGHSTTALGRIDP